MKKAISRIVIVGASGHGLVTLEAALAQGYEVAGFLDSFKPVGYEVFGYRVLGHPDDLAFLMKKHSFTGGVLAISNNFSRFCVASKISQLVPNFEFATIIHPSAWISPSAVIGVGTLVLTGAIIHARCQVGIHAIINTKASLDHESKLGNFASILPGVTTGGAVQIGDFSCICAAVTLSHKAVVGRHTVVGAGSLVLRSLPDEVLAYGIPARVIRARKQDECHF